MKIRNHLNLNLMALFFFLLFEPIVFAQTTQIEYTLSMNKPYTHYFEILININNWQKDSIDLKMPVWTPGSYLVRDFSKNVDEFSAEGADGKKLPFEKIDKNTWRIFNGSKTNLKINYEVYAFELSVRTSFLNADEGYINGASIFMYIEGFKEIPLTLTIITLQKLERNKHWNGKCK
jgi:predicted metalloprotease with PDZ domain